MKNVWMSPVVRALVGRCPLFSVQKVAALDRSGCTVCGGVDKEWRCLYRCDVAALLGC
jgi:hypothetical protein